MSRQSRTVWRSILGAIVAALVMAGPLAARTHVIPGGNLVKNGDAEASPGASSATQTVAPAGWTTTGGLSAVQYSRSSGFLTPDDAAKVGGGANFFAGGPKTGVGTAIQTIDVSGASAEIDGGHVVAKLSALLGGYADQGDSAVVEAAFLDASGARLGAIHVGPVTPADRKQTTALLPRAAAGAVPKGTVQIAVTIAAKRVEGDYDDGYVDNVALELSEATASTPPATTPKQPIVRLTVTCAKRGIVARATVGGGHAAWVRFSAGKTVVLDRRAPFTATFAAGSAKRPPVIAARARVGQRTVVVSRKAHAC